MGRTTRMRRHDPPGGAARAPGRTARPPAGQHNPGRAAQPGRGIPGRGSQSRRSRSEVRAVELPEGSWRRRPNHLRHHRPGPSLTQQKSPCARCFAGPASTSTTRPLVHSTRPSRRPAGSTPARHSRSPPIPRVRAHRQN
ncbi:hypothetical protein ACFPM0_15915 [Pseudonocardia sulfidoxydans]|uniref:hypothetical protein n=1 Tax=Pseudonocardia sulfidoxydans TaxID=54011 RepID=UPI0036237393